VIKYLIGEVKSQLKNYNRSLYNQLIGGASEDELAQYVKRLSAHEINKMLVAELAKNIVRYLNNETKVLCNTNQVDSLSVSNQQGDFIYDILTAFQIYHPKQRANNTAVKHHDTIRKLIKRSAIIDEDKQDLN